MTFSNIAKRVSKFTIDNSPLLLTSIGVAGTVTTAYLTGKASFKASRVLIEETTKLNAEKLRSDDWVQLDSLELKDAFNLIWRYYVPPVLVGTATIAAIVGANQIGTRRAAALAAAFTLSERAFEEYREKIVESIGEHKEQGVRDDLAQARVNASPVSQSTVLVGSGEVLCYEWFTDRYFNSSVENIKKAMNDVNYMINNDGYASLSDFYDKLGLPRTSMSDEVGWSHAELMEIHFTTTLSEDGRPCVAIDYKVKPVRDYFRFR